MEIDLMDEEYWLVNFNRSKVKEFYNDKEKRQNPRILYRFWRNYPLVNFDAGYFIFANNILLFKKQMNSAFSIILNLKVNSFSK
ncbi:hypothetical protein OAZ92_01210 [Prochlorococcus sp. AH-736-E02]|nr:hypothetical protein [Prochlorococcus sp. AH-736-E02]